MDILANTFRIIALTFNKSCCKIVTGGCFFYLLLLQCNLIAMGDFEMHRFTDNFLTYNTDLRNLFIINIFKIYIFKLF